MKQINFPLIWDYIKSYIIPIVAVILIISQINSCGNEKAIAEIETKYEILESDYEILEAESKLFKAERDNNARLLSESDERVEKNERTIDSLQKVIVKNTNKANAEKDKVKNYDNEAFARYFNDRYQTNKAVSNFESVDLKTGLPLIVANDLIDGDVAKANFKLQTEKYTELYSNFNELTGQITILKDENNNLAHALTKTEKLLDDSLQLNEDAVKQLKKMKFKAPVSQYLVPVAVIAGIVAGVVIAK